MSSGEKRLYTGAVHLFQHAEDGGNALDLAAVILDTLQGARALLPELTVEIRISTSRPTIMGVRLSRKISCRWSHTPGVTTLMFLLLLTEKTSFLARWRARNAPMILAPVQTYDGVHPLVIGVVLGQGHGQLPGPW